MSDEREKQDPPNEVLEFRVMTAVFLFGVIYIKNVCFLMIAGALASPFGFAIGGFIVSCFEGMNFIENISTLPVFGLVMAIPAMIIGPLTALPLFLVIIAPYLAFLECIKKESFFFNVIVTSILSMLGPLFLNIKIFPFAHQFVDVFKNNEFYFWAIIFWVTGFIGAFMIYKYKKRRRSQIRKIIE